MSKNQLT